MPDILLPGHRTPEFRIDYPLLDNEIDFDQNNDGYGVLLFWDKASSQDVFETLEKYLDRIDEFKTLGASLIGFTNAKTDQPYVFDTDGHERILFANKSSIQETTHRFGVLSAQKIIQPTVYLVGPGNLIRKVYTADQYPTLPNPAMILRAQFGK